MVLILLWGCIGSSLLGCAAAVVAAVFAAKCAREKNGEENRQLLRELSRLREELLDESRQTRQENAQNITRSVNALGQALVAGQNQMSRELSARQDSLQQSIAAQMSGIDARFQGFSLQSEQQLSGIRATVEGRLTSLQADNAAKLEQMRQTVDEKLQKTLEARLGQSFRTVEARLEQVYRGLGEMQTLAAGVGDLKKVLSNVKTRGVLGEVQLGAILEQILAPGQYRTNVVTRPGSRNPVEYAVILPGDGEEVLLPIDAKFPADAYVQLSDAYENGDPAAVAAASALLCTRVKAFAKDIRDKYIDPPHTTDFAVMFLPFEGLYAQVLQLGLLELLQREYHVSIAGPTTMAALITSLQMGFQTLAIQKRSGEVWKVLGEVKTEFDRFGEVLGAAQQRIEQAGSELDKLVGVRSRAIQRKLALVTEVEGEAPQGLLPAEERDEA